ELDAAELQVEHPRQGLDEFGLPQTRHAFEEHVAAGEDGDQRRFDDALLADDHLADRRPGEVEILLKLAGFFLDQFGGGHGRSCRKNSKSQTPSFKQISNSKCQTESIVRFLGTFCFEICLELEIWNLELTSCLLLSSASIATAFRSSTSACRRSAAVS